MCVSATMRPCAARHPGRTFTITGRTHVQRKSIMSIVLAALDAQPDRPIGARHRIQDRRVDQLPMSRQFTSPQPTNESVKALTDRAHVPLQLLPGPLEPALLNAVEAPGVVAAVIGTKASGARSASARDDCQAHRRSSTKPVVIVPPDFVAPDIFRRLLIPLEGTEASSQPVLEVLAPLPDGRRRAHRRPRLHRVHEARNARPPLARSRDAGKRVPLPSPPSSRGQH